MPTQRSATARDLRPMSPLFGGAQASEAGTHCQPAQLAPLGTLWLKMQHMGSRLTIAVLLLLSGFAHAQDEAATKKADDGTKSGVSAILGTLDWGAAHPSVLTQVKADIDARYQDRLEVAAGDTLAIDRILREKTEEFKTVKKTFTRFTGQRTGYESSLISRDFDAAGDEAVLVVEQEDAQRYYFFKGDQLWKVLLAYNSSVSSRVPFDDFLKKVKGAYGGALHVEWYTPKGGTKRVRSATWEDDATVLVVEDRTDFFGTFVMKYLEKSEGAAREAALAQKKAAEAQPQADPQMESMLDDITGGSDDDGGNVVDEMTGSSADVDLESGKPKYDTLVRASDLRAEKAEKGRKKKARKDDEREPAKKKTQKKPRNKPLGDPGIVF